MSPLCDHREGYSSLFCLHSLEGIMGWAAQRLCSKWKESTNRKKKKYEEEKARITVPACKKSMSELSPLWNRFPSSLMTWSKQSRPCHSPSLVSPCQCAESRRLEWPFPKGLKGNFPPISTLPDALYPLDRFFLHQASWITSPNPSVPVSLCCAPQVSPSTRLLLTQTPLGFGCAHLGMPDMTPMGLMEDRKEKFISGAALVVTGTCLHTWIFCFLYFP